MQQSNDVQLIESTSTFRRKLEYSKISNCFFAALLVVSLATIFIVSKYYQNQIDKNIDAQSTLKDNTLAFWGQIPNTQPILYQKSYRLYDYKGPQSTVDESKFELSSNTHVFDYVFKYTNISYSQGNTGLINLLNKWSLVDKNSAENAKVTNLNLGLNKAFYQQYYAPIQKKFPILFHQIIKSLKQQFLPQFFTQYLFEFFFKDTQLVKQTIFAPLRIPEDTQNNLINDAQYGWGNPITLQPWMELSLSQYFSTQTYSNLKQAFGLTDSQMKKLVGSTSTLSHLAYALNGTIRGKLLSKLKYSCLKNICSDDELIAAQWSAAFLTRNELMAGTNLNKVIKDMNTTFKKDVQYSQFCQAGNYEMCMGIAEAIPLFIGQKSLFSFETINFIVENQDNLGIIEKQLNIAGYGQSLVDYVTKYFYNQIILDTTSEQDFTWAWLNYRNFNLNFQVYTNFLTTNLFGKALYPKFKKNCELYFVGFENYSNLCNNDAYKIGNSQQSYYPFINAYFLTGRDSFLAVSGMTFQQSQVFFATSLFATEIKSIQADFGKHYQCAGPKCSLKELIARQWGKNQILSDLPAAYFPNTNINILDWDTKSVFNVKNPQYWNFDPKNSFDLDQLAHILSYDNSGILGLFPLMARLTGKDMLIDYITQNLLTQTFSGIFVNKTQTDYLFGYPDSYLAKRQTWQPIQGGTPWQKPIAAAIRKNNTDYLSKLLISQLSQINSGIYVKDTLRRWKQIDGRYASGFKYSLYQDKDSTVDTWIDTGNSIQGSNLMGFHPNIKAEESLFVYIEELKRALELEYVSKQSGQYTIYKYQFKPCGNIDLGKDNFDHTFAEINPNSFLRIESFTGETVEAQINLEIKTRFVIDRQDHVIPLYQSQIQLQRSNTAVYEQIQKYSNTLKSYIAALISVACFSLVMIIISSILCLKWRKSAKEQDSEDYRPINTSEIRSMITDTVVSRIEQ